MIKDYYYYFVVGAMIIGALGYFVASFRKSTGATANNVIELLQQEVAALKSRLETTTLQVTQLNSQVIALNTNMAQLKQENDFLKKLINDALNHFFREQGSVVSEVKERIK